MQRVVKGHKCYVEIIRNEYLPATPENVAKASAKHFLEQLHGERAQGCRHIVWYDEPDSYMYTSRICADCGVCIELI